MHFIPSTCKQEILLLCSMTLAHAGQLLEHDDFITWKHFPRYWSFVRGVHRAPMSSPHKDQWHWASMLSLICAWIYVWVNCGEADYLRRHRAHYDVTLMVTAVNDSVCKAQCVLVSLKLTLIARFMGPTWGPSGADRTQVGPMLAPWTLLSGKANTPPAMEGTSW